MAVKTGAKIFLKNLTNIANQKNGGKKARNFFLLSHECGEQRNCRKKTSDKFFEESQGRREQKNCLKKRAKIFFTESHEYREKK